MALKSLQDLLVAQLGELYSAERQSERILPSLADAASDKALKSTLKELSGQAKRHVERIEGVFKTLEIKPRAKATQAIKGLVEDCVALSKNVSADPEVRDAALIAAAQHLQHDEIAGYGCAATWANLLGQNEAAKVLQQTLAEEKELDTRLTKTAEQINRRAVHAVMR